MKKINILTFGLLAFIWITTQSVNCRRPRPNENCGNLRQDSILFKIDVINQAATFTLADSIKLYSKISDTITPVLSSSFIYPIAYSNAIVQVFKVVPLGSSYQLNYANIEFNMNVQIGTIQGYQGVGYNILYNRTQPINEVQFSLKPGVPGLYAVVINDRYYNIYIQNPSDYCLSFITALSFSTAKQNLQYWNTLGGITTLNLASSNGNISINKNDRNYFFVKIIP